MSGMMLDLKKKEMKDTLLPFLQLKTIPQRQIYLKSKYLLPLFFPSFTEQFSKCFMFLTSSHALIVAYH